MSLGSWDDGLTMAAGAGLVVSVACLLAVAPTRIRIRRSRLPGEPGVKLPARVVPLLGLAMASPPAAAREVVPAPWKDRLPTTAPWSEPDPSLPPPPDGYDRPTVRPPLRKKEQAPDPNQKAASGTRRHVVQAGDSLWRIAQSVLQTGDNRAIAAYWPRIYRANRVVIGEDPNLILVGQVLALPAIRATQ